MTAFANNDFFPVANATVPFWRTELHTLDKHRSTPDLPTTFDIVIIGAGYAGISTAYHLVDDNPAAPPNIVLLEAREACSGATARNGGHLRPDVLWSVMENAQKHGLDMAIKVADFEQSHLSVIKQLIWKKKIDCDFTLTRSMHAFVDEEMAQKAEKIYETLADGEYSCIKNVHFTAKNAELVSGIKGAKACFSFDAAHLWPYKLFMHLLSEAVAKGVNLQTNTPATAVSDTPDKSGFWTVTTPRGAVRAKKVVFTSNAYTAGVAPQYAGKIVPVRNICARIKTPDEGRPPPHLSNTYVISFADGKFDYMMPRPDGSIIAGAGPIRQMWDRKQWYNVTDDSQLIKPTDGHFDQTHFDGFMQRSFTGWEDSGAYTDRVWSGIMGYTTD